MALPASGQLGMKQIWEEIHGVSHTGQEISLNQLVSDSSLADKVPPYQISDFFGYDHSSYATLSVTPSAWTYGQAQEDKTYTVIASLGNSWQAQLSYIIGSGWMSFVGSDSGVGTGSAQYFTVRAATNSDGEPDRTGTITVVSDAPNDTVDVTQDWH